VMLNVNNKNVQFKLDAGYSVTIVNQREYSDLWNSELETCDISLKTYTGEKVNILGATRVTVMYQGKELPLVVVIGSGPNLLGRGWIATQPSHKTLRDVIAKHEMVLKTQCATPQYFKPRSVPCAMKPKVEAELDHLLKEKGTEPVKFSDWAAPTVPVLKPDDGSVRICGDYKLTVRQHPVPKTDGLFAILSGEQFTKLDVSHAAYQQIVLEEDSKKYVTVTTRKGLLRYNQLPFGVSSVPAIFQCTMEGLLQGIPHVAVYLDDILVTGMTEVEHLENLEEVLNRLEKAGLCLRSKCTFKAKGVVFLGHKVDATGLHPVKEKVQAIQDAPAPSNVSELKAYLYKELILSYDASPYGIGTVLSHRMKDGLDRPIGFVSRTPTVAERNYSQLHKETAVIFGVQKFHIYVYERCFTICTDHKPLISLFNHMDTAPVIATQIKTWTGKDPASSKVCEYVLRGWPNSKTDAELTPFFLRRHELSVQDGCILRGARIIVPKPGHGAVMEQLHQSHPGITRMKGLARSYMWWLKMDVGVERKVQSCRTCQEHWKAPAAAPLHPWEWPDKP
uniref:Gypsy retrotransposon integrase-like protein 1 n=1 Tax=Latimeria chalumnae TaxID=7897 RepID=H3ARH3_LATCH